MGPIVKQIIHRFITRSDGVGTVTSLFLLVGMLMVGGLAVDYSNGVRAQARLQALADVVAMSAAVNLPDPALTLQVAQNAVALNRPAGQQGIGDIAARDIQIGRWNSATRGFEPGSIDPNAVLVTARNAEGNGNALSTFLLRLVGIDRLDVSASAIGFRSHLPRCSGGGFFSRERTAVVNSNQFTNGFCVHGDQGVTLNNVNYFEAGTTIGMRNLADFIEHRNNYGAAEALRRNVHNFAQLDAMPAMMAAMRAGNLAAANLPAYITQGPVSLNQVNSSTTLVPGTLYVVSGNVNLGSNITIADVAIVASGTIRVNSNTVLRNVVLASDGAITLNSNNYVGQTAESYCATGDYSSYLMTARDITMNTNNTLRGVMMLAQGGIDTGNNNDANDGIYAEANQRISLGNANSTAGCPDGLRRRVGEENLGEISPNLVY